LIYDGGGHLAVMSAKGGRDTRNKEDLSLQIFELIEFQCSGRRLFAIVEDSAGTPRPHLFEHQAGSRIVNEFDVTNVHSFTSRGL
jgi:hypothetical protein